MSDSSSNVITLNPNKIDFAERINSAMTEFDLFQICAQLAAFYGYRYFSILRLPRIDEKNLAELDFISNWPDFMIAEYDNNNLLDASPVIKHLRSSTEPLIFNTREINNERPEQEKSLATELFQEYGIFNGIYFSVHMANGKLGAVSFCGDSNEITTANLVELNYLANLIYSRMNILKFDISSQSHQLNTNEIKCLNLLSHGKNVAEIAKEVSLTEHTVSIYLQNISRKLDCQNTVQAVSKAIRLGILD